MIGKGTIIENAEIGEDANIGFYNVIRDGAKIGKNVYISHHCVIARGTIIEDNVFIGPGVMITNTRKICHGRDRKHTGETEYVVIRRGARIGAGAVLVAGVEVGEEALIGAGAVVVKDCMPFCRYVGSPARCIGPVPKEEYLKQNG